MVTVRISDRLKAVADYVKKGARVADIGTDHGYLPIYLVVNDIADYAYACDVRKGPLSRASNHISLYGADEKVKVILADGFGGVEKGQADTFTICGMGGKLMQSIITNGLDRLSPGDNLILSPQSEIRDFREFLYTTGFDITDETILKEDGKYYFVMNCVYLPDNRNLWDENASDDNISGKNVSECILRYGQYLPSRRDEILKEYLMKELESLESIEKKLKNNRGSQSAEKRLEIINEDISYINEALEYYNGDR
ncbi:MAG: class I SAM-dependent methyltransferase [Eubacteriales bacterium]|nr:class I SAM-dependent methyltransferase [Eubacteriales bacterium]